MIRIRTKIVATAATLALAAGGLVAVPLAGPAAAATSAEVPGERADERDRSRWRSRSGTA